MQNKMTLPISWNVQCKLKDGQLDAFRLLAAEMIYSVKNNEPDALNYEWFFSADMSICHISVSYRNVQAVLEHLQMFRETYSDRFYACVERTGISVYGEINQEVRDIFDRFDVVYLDDFGGFRR